MPASLLERVDLAGLRAAAARCPGGWGTIAACLLAPGVVQRDPDDPEWPDRDRLVVGDAAGGEAIESALLAAGHGPGTGWLDATGGHALAIARGLAVASELDGGIFRVWCLLGEAALADGATWEAAVDAPASSLVLVTASPQQAGARFHRFLGLAGWRVAHARAEEPAEVLGGLDQALLGGRPGALVAAWSGP